MMCFCRVSAGIGGRADSRLQREPGGGAGQCCHQSSDKTIPGDDHPAAASGQDQQGRGEGLVVEEQQHQEDQQGRGVEGEGLIVEEVITQQQHQAKISKVRWQRGRDWLRR